MRTCPTCKVKYPENVTFCLQDGTSLVGTHELSEGAVVRGKYRVLNKIAQGDMSSVYKAMHLRLDEVRALKVMDAELARDPLFLKRFEQEALLTRKLQHPNVMRVDDIDETEDGRPFMIMEYVEGKSLKKVIQEEGPLPAPRVCAIASQVASALDAAHQLGMIHRDIKPENIELIQTTSGEQAKVLEFGSAKLKEARVGQSDGMLTLSGALAVIGTPQYMSPELSMGKRGDELDGRSDLYTLGIVMYEMLTGALPFKSGTMMHMIMSHVQTPPLPIQTVRPDLKIPEPLAALVMKCLEKDRDSRPPSAKALVEELHRLEGQQPAPPTTAEPKPTTVLVQPPPKPAVPAAPQAAISQSPASKPAAPVNDQAVNAKPRAEVLQSPPKPAVSAAIPRPPLPEPRPPAPSIPVAPSGPDAEVVRPSTPSLAAITPPPRRSRLGAATLVMSVVILVGAGVWYATSRSRNQTASPSGINPGQASGGAQGNRPQGQRVVSQPSGTGPGGAPVQAPGSGPANQPPSQPAVAQPGPATPGASQGAGQSPAEASQASPGETAAAGTSMGSAKPRRTSSAGLAEQIRAAARQGDFYYDNGQYDSALWEYEKGLKLDPSNTLLLQRIQRARNAKATEDAIK